MRTNIYMKLELLCKKRRGYIGTRELLEEGFSNRQIAALAEEGYLEKICYGYYWLPGNQCEKPSDYKCIEVCLSNPRAVICMDSACYYQGYAEMEPECLSVATERTDRSLLKMNFPVRRHYFSSNKFHCGILRKETEFGCYNIYEVERSACDMLRFEMESAGDVIGKIRGSERQYQRLLTYAQLLRITLKNETGRI